MRCAPLAALALFACNETVIDTDPDEQIEITGYMDAARVEVTATQQVDVADAVQLIVVGLPGSVTNVVDVTVENPRTGESVDVPAQPDGAFVAGVDVLDDDLVTVSSPLADPVDIVVEPLGALPGMEEEVFPPNDQGNVVVILFVGEHPAELELRLSNPVSGDVAEITRLPEGEQWIGEVPAQGGDTLLVHGVNAGGTTLAEALEVPE